MMPAEYFLFNSFALYAKVTCRNGDFFSYHFLSCLTFLFFYNEHVSYVTRVVFVIDEDKYTYIYL